MCESQQPCPMAPLHVYKSLSGRYALSTEETEGDKIATFTDAGQHLPRVLTQLTLTEKDTVVEPLDTILAIIYAQLATRLQEEEWVRYITPCHRDSATVATQVKKALRARLGKGGSKRVLHPFRERILSKRGHATRLLVNPQGQTLALRSTLPRVTLPLISAS